jgi:hypothetical protein
MRYKAFEPIGRNEDRMPEATNEFISQQLVRVIDRLGAIEDQITVLTGMTIRNNGAVAGLAMEVQGLVQATNRTSNRLRKLEDAEDAR